MSDALLPPTEQPRIAPQPSSHSRSPSHPSETCASNELTDSGSPQRDYQPLYHCRAIPVSMNCGARRTPGTPPQAGGACRHGNHCSYIYMHALAWLQPAKAFQGVLRPQHVAAPFTGQPYTVALRRICQMPSMCMPIQMKPGSRWIIIGA